MLSNSNDCTQCGSPAGPDATRSDDVRHAGQHVRTVTFRCPACGLSYAKVYAGEVGGPLTHRETRPLKPAERAAHDADAAAGERVVQLEPAAA